MKKQVNRILSVALLLNLSILFFYSSCKKRSTENLIPNVPVNITVNMELPLYFDLQQPGNYVYLNGGNKGITLFHGFDGEFYATDRICPYLPFEECSRVEQDGNYTFRCGHTSGGTFEKCCDSKFQYDGAVSNGPAEYGLKPYRVYRSGNILEIVN